MQNRGDRNIKLKRNIAKGRNETLTKVRKKERHFNKSGS